jgi:hypothetical protein
MYYSFVADESELNQLRSSWIPSADDSGNDVEEGYVECDLSWTRGRHADVCIGDDGRVGETARERKEVHRGRFPCCPSGAVVRSVRAEASLVRIDVNCQGSRYRNSRRNMALLLDYHWRRSSQNGKERRSCQSGVSGLRIEGVGSQIQ